MFQRNQSAQTGAITRVTLSSGYTAKVKRLKPFQFAKAGHDFPARPWTESAEAQQMYESWFARMAPFVDCPIDRAALAQLRAEMAALEVVLPESDKLLWIAYGLCANAEDLESIVHALVPIVG